MINFNYLNLDKMPLLTSLLGQFNLGIPTDFEIWQIARNFDEIPNFEDILLTECCERIENYLFSYYQLECDFFVNGKATKFFINGTPIMNFDEVQKHIKNAQSKLLSAC